MTSLAWKAAARGETFSLVLTGNDASTILLSARAKRSPLPPSRSALAGGLMDAPYKRFWEDRTLSLEWREDGGPPVEEPTRRGFGLRL